MTAPIEEVYNIKELAVAMGVPWQTVMAWRRNHQIPSASMTPDGKFIKSVIDPFIEWYKNNPATDTPMRQEMCRQLSLPQKDSHPDMAKKKTKITYSPEVRQKAIRLLTEQKLSTAEVAKKLGCSYQTVVNWQKKEEGSPAPAKSKASSRETSAAPVVTTSAVTSSESSVTAPEVKASEASSEISPEVSVTPSPKPVQQRLLPELDFDTFVRNFWNEGTRAVDALLMPPDIGPKVVNYVNEALKYAFETLR
jgi:transposase-like protein